MNKSKIILLSVIAVAIAGFFIAGGNEYLNLATIQATRGNIISFYLHHPWLTPAIFFISYIFITALSLPGAAIMTLLSGALFSLPLGIVLCSFASTIGATLACWVARYLFRDTMERRFTAQLVQVNAGIQREGLWYLLTIRMVPLFPFFVVNIVMGLTNMRLFNFAWVSQLGMLPMTAIFVFTGKELGSLQSTADILNPALLLAMVCIGLLPLSCKKLLDWRRKRRSVADIAQS